MIEQFNYENIERLVYVWARYAGMRDKTKEGKHYSSSDISNLIYLNKPNLIAFRV
jgi:hypothetical protein